jgi:DNA-binding transcriptional LysR family regulator
MTATSRQATPSGALRINASIAAAHQMWPIFEEYVRRYPAVTLDLATDGRFVDVVDEGFDAGVRLAESVPKDMIAIPIGPRQSFAVVGSAPYFRKYPKPKSPAAEGSSLHSKAPPQRVHFQMGVRKARRAISRRR